MHGMLKDKDGNVVFSPYKEGPDRITQDGKTYSRIDVPARNPDGTRADFSYYQVEARKNV